MKNAQGPVVSHARETSSSRMVQTLFANVWWYAFLAVLSFLTFFATGRVWDDVFKDTVGFLFLILGGGFTFASVLDAFYERYYGSKGAGEKSLTPCFENRFRRFCVSCALPRPLCLRHLR